MPIHTLAALIVRAARDEADVRLATRIEGAATRMSALIEAMLAFSRSGRLPRGRTELRTAVEEALEDLRPAVAGAEVVVDVQESTVACAPEVLGQVLRNVVGNALKYRAPDRPCRLEISTRNELRWVTLSVADNGQGMEPAAAERALEPFFRGTSEGSGHGLGLAIVDSYLRALGGSVQLRSALGVGTWVWLRIPRTTPAPEGLLETRGLERRGGAAGIPGARAGRHLPGNELPRGRKGASWRDRCHA